MAAPDWFTYMEKARQSCAASDFTRSDQWVEKALNDAKLSPNGIPPKYYGRAPYSPSSLSGELATLAEYYKWWGKYDKAETYFRQAISFSTQDDRITYLEALAKFYVGRGNYKEAEALYEDSLLYAEAKYSHTDKVGHCLLKLADCYVAQKNFGEAEALYQKNIDVLEKEPSESNFYDLVYAFIAIGQCRLKESKLSDAKNSLQKALEIDAKELKDAGRSVITSYLGDLAVASKDDKRAQELYKESLDQNKYAIAPEMKDTTRTNYAALLRRLGKVSQAEALEHSGKENPHLPMEATDVKQHFRHYLPSLYQ